MPDTIELSKSDFVSVMAVATTRCGPWLPGEEPIPGWIEPDPEACRHWLELVAVTRAADTVITAALERHNAAEAFDGEARVALDGNRASLLKAVEEICGTPPRHPIPWPPRGPILNLKELSGVQVLAVGARFQAAAAALGEHALAPALADAADAAFERGLERMKGIPKPEPA